MTSSIKAIRRILVPTDFSSSAKAGLEYARALAESFGASIEVLHVWESPSLFAPDAVITSPGEPSRTLSALVEERANRGLADLIANQGAPAPAKGLKIVGRLKEGLPADVIVAIASEDAFDLIVMGTHGRSGFSRWLLGSVAETVVRRAPCPVLTVRGKLSEETK